jgi:hypothetical protein
MSVGSHRITRNLREIQQESYLASSGFVETGTESKKAPSHQEFQESKPSVVVRAWSQLLWRLRREDPLSPGKNISKGFHEPFHKDLSLCID